MTSGNKKQLTGFTVQKDAETEKWHVFLRTNRRSGYQSENLALSLGITTVERKQLVEIL